MIAKLPEKGRESGIKLGAAAAQIVIVAHKLDTEPVEDYRPVITPGKYAPNRGADLVYRQSAQMLGIGQS